MIFYWFLVRPKTSGVKCLIEQNGKFLMIRNTYGEKHWTLPGGGIKKGESPERAALREVEEEVGILLSSVRKIGEYRSNREYKADTIHCFYATANSPKISIDKGEILEAAWFTPQTIPSFRSTATEKVLDLYRSSS
ncbi:MAG: hypothetical protein A3F99_00085 [Candidatus Colwellbacteria bacterium RIFCSPLOWO2_12_FULL_43_11]|uniref:Nudix hydrolase domain-containing protein n=1 Tax=Candidatus Colwellbacteria bacterium RIFCSPLOWO2_12_FULL_43_11 TaxID=1797693 RepID=A0A1G1ZC01_9BACT|nr:MAG: hypothetical protein A3F99_00085 [Candidatus Colwellbacteria bacterium RIFCSPLOWO2_12_FULL_43_11]